MSTRYLRKRNNNIRARIHQITPIFKCIFFIFLFFLIVGRNTSLSLYNFVSRLLITYWYIYLRNRDAYSG